MSVFVQDTFTRGNQSGFGTASGGGTWTLQFSSPTLSITSNEGKATALAGNDWMAYLGGTITDVDVYVRCTNSNFPSDGLGIYVRYVDTDNWYRVFLFGGSFTVDTKVAGTFTGGATVTYSPVNNTFYWIRVRISSSTLQAKIWSGTLGSEPGSFQINTTVTGVSGPGYVGIGAYQDVSADISQFDNFTASTLTTTVTTTVTETATGSEALTSLATFQPTITEQAGGSETITTNTYSNVTINSATVTEQAPAGAEAVTLFTFGVFTVTEQASGTEAANVLRSITIAEPTPTGAEAVNVFYYNRFTVSELPGNVERIYAANVAVVKEGPGGSELVEVVTITASDPTAPMQGSDLMSQYARIRNSAVNHFIKILATTYYGNPTANSPIYGELDVVFSNETVNQLHALRTRQDITNFMQVYSYPSAVMADNPLAYYRLGEPSGSATVADSMSRYATGTITGGVTLHNAGINGADTSAHFDGSTGYITLPSSLSPANWQAFSFDVWINQGSQGSNGGTVFANDNPAVSKNGINLNLSQTSGLGNVTFGVGSTSYTVSLGSTPITSQWLHVAVVYSANAITCYVNGQQSSKTTLTTLPIANGAYALTIGKNPSTNTAFYLGNVEEVAFYSYALTRDQVLLHYNAGIGAI